MHSWSGSEKRINLKKIFEKQNNGMEEVEEHWYPEDITHNFSAINLNLFLCQPYLKLETKNTWIQIENVVLKSIFFRDLTTLHYGLCSLDIYIIAVSPYNAYYSYSGKYISLQFQKGITFVSFKCTL